jgi:probable rRNA maturation factor
LTLTIDNRQDKYDTDGFQKIIESVIEKTIEHHNIKKECQISVIFVDNFQIKDINNEYRGIDSPTDVLSFPMIEYVYNEEVLNCKEDIWRNIENIDIDTGELVLGDIVLSLEKAYDQSSEYGHSVDREIAFLTVHGMLHLLGYDHETEKDGQNMRLMEEDILSILNMQR